jgi:hypothetical protein
MEVPSQLCDQRTSITKQWTHVAVCLALPIVPGKVNVDLPIKIVGKLLMYGIKKTFSRSDILRIFLNFIQDVKNVVLAHISNNFE